MISAIGRSWPSASRVTIAPRPFGEAIGSRISRAPHGHGPLLRGEPSINSVEGIAQSVRKNAATPRDQEVALALARAGCHEVEENVHRQRGPSPVTEVFDIPPGSGRVVR